MYTCDHCGSPVKANREDPIHLTSRGRFCAKCLGPGNPPPEVKDGTARGAAQRARWAAMTPEEKAARTAHLRAARGTP